VKAKKELIVKTNKVGDYRIVYEGGGPAPAALQGAWTKMKVAKDAIKLYLIRDVVTEQEELEEKNRVEAAQKEVAEKNLKAIKDKAMAKKAKQAEKQAEKLDGEGSD